MPLDQNTSPESEGYLQMLFETRDENFLYYNWNR